MFGKAVELVQFIKEKMNSRILEINKNIQSYKDEIVNHPLYKKMNSVEDIVFFNGTSCVCLFGTLCLY